MPRDAAASAASKEPEDFVEVDPSGRYGRYAEVLGRGAYKIVYKAFDELEGMEVAWNQVKAADVLRKSDNLDRLRSEVHLLQTLKHKNIIKCYSSWVDSKQDNINFITEVFTSGNLREYRNKHKHVNIRALKNWSRQILQGLVYLHSHGPPVIHRDLKCDNIFVNGNQGEVKIGDLGLAAILYQAHAAHSVIGTPEFMAPELYEEEYNELVDIYAFGMCLLELVTLQYPYSECTNAAQIFKKVSSGIKPASLAKVNDPEVKTFIEKCIADVSKRLSARELLNDPFLLTSAETPNSALRLRPRNSHEDGILNLANRNAGPSEPADSSLGTDFTVEGRRKDVHTIFLKLKIPNSSGKNVHDIHFPFHIESDTAVNVAREMVSVLVLPDQDVMAIASMIDSEIRNHIPNWMSEQTAGNNYSDKVQDQKVDTESKDGISDLPTEPENSPANFLLDRLPSGHIFWCDSPNEKDEDSSLYLPFSSFVNIDSGSVKGNLSAGEESAIGKMNDEGTHTVSPQNEQDWDVAFELEKLLIQQHKELDELHKKHEKAVQVLLRRLPKELRSETLRKCRSKVQTITGVQT